MSLLDDHAINAEGETWTLADDPEDEAPLPWPEDQSDGDRVLRT